jgi:hypothetical protein
VTARRMSSSITLLSCLLLCTWVMAQQEAGSPASSATQNSGTQPAGVQNSGAQNSATQGRTAEITIRGCVTGETRYTFLQENTGAIFDVTGDTRRLADAKGKLIEVTGNEFAPQANTGELPKLRINNFHVIADKCPIQTEVPRTTNSQFQQPGPPTPPTPQTPPYRDPGRVNQAPPNANNPNVSGDTGSPSPGTGNPPPASEPPQPPQ